MAKVLNKHTATAAELANAVSVMRPTKWGNPFVIGRDGTREQVIDQHREWLLYGDGYYLTNSLDELRGKNLVCCCAPQPCHADLLLHLAN